ncbi:Bug family tripartite tricarboxylate transporter substrate binding protein [Lacisediminimonas profundi]|uniref:Bug family tripartite tricarboxylate transporter substrate binding protein n=1 Tax=Lacisediminimonas profundi TaxID=2603856 RepID=UPI00124B5D7F|nr:tripartite tricarboxylate transporter substrate binding protein [Lacisediminimonas profundi]
MHSIKTATRRLIISMAVAMALPAVCLAQAYPTKQIKIIVGYAPGGTTDIIARVLANRLTTTMGQTVIVENRAGAGGNIGAEAVAKAAPDGYTLQMGTAGNMTVTPSIYPNMPFDTVRDFQPISLVATLPNLMVVNPKVPAKNVQEFVAWAKARPGQVFFASSGTGNTPHMTAELFNIAAGLQMVHVPYKGSGPALTDLIGGNGVHVMLDNMPSAIGYARNGSLRALAVTSPKRVSSEPNVPTISESGYPDFQVVTWFGLFAPAKTPAHIVEMLHREVAEAVRSPEVAKKLLDLGAEPTSNTPAEFAALVKSDIAKWSKVVKAANIKGP